MADEMNTERDMPEGITRDDTVHGETYYTASDMATASAQGFRGGVASLSAPLQSALDVIERWARDAYVVCGKPSTQEGFEAAWKAEDADAYATWVAGRASLAANAPAATAADGKWYMLSRDGMATLCADRDDAMKEAASADKLYPNGAPHRALQLVAANAGGEPVAGMNEYGVRGYLAATLKCWHRLTGDEAVELVAMTQRLSGLYTHPSPQAAQQAPAGASASGLQEQHDRDSRELRSLCESRDQARRERDECKAEIAGLEASCATMGRLIDDLRKDGDRLEWVLRRCAGSWLRAHLGVANDTGNMDELRVLIDANRGAAPAAPSTPEAGGELLELALAQKEYIDALPDDVVAKLPAMPGFDGDWAAEVLERAQTLPASPTIEGESNG